jgi:hypothetical protein
MKYSVFVTTTVFCTVEVDGEDPEDAARKTALAIATDEGFLSQRGKDHMIDEIEFEVSTVADVEAMAAASDDDLFEFDKKIICFDAETVGQWLSELLQNYGVPYRVAP